MLYDGPSLGPNGDVTLRACPRDVLAMLQDILLRSGPFALDDRYWADPAKAFASVADGPQCLMFAAWDGDALSGFVYLTDVWPDRTAWVHGYGYPMHPAKPARAITLGLDFAFERWRLAKVFTEHCTLNRGATLVVKRAGMRIEATIKGNRYHGGRPYDSLVLGITREEHANGRRRG